jgi:hypothetical protein
MARLDAKWYNFWARGQTWYHFWQDTKGIVNTQLDATPGSLSITGGSASIVINRNVSVSSGFLTFSGSSIYATISRLISVNGGLLQLSGSQISVTVNKLLSANPGVLTLSGGVIFITYSPFVQLTGNIGAGSYGERKRKEWIKKDDADWEVLISAFVETTNY